MRLSAFGIPVVAAAVLTAAACDRRAQQEALSTDPQTTLPADRDANRSSDDAAPVTARDADGARTSAPPVDGVGDAPPADAPDNATPEGR